MPPCHCRSVHVAMRRALLFCSVTSCFVKVPSGFSPSVFVMQTLHLPLCSAVVVFVVHSWNWVWNVLVVSWAQRMVHRRVLVVESVGLGVSSVWTSCTVDRMPCKPQQLQPQCCRGEEKRIPYL